MPTTDEMHGLLILAGLFALCFIGPWWARRYERKHAPAPTGTGEAWEQDYVYDEVFEEDGV